MKQSGPYCDNKKELTPKQATAITSLVSGATIEEAAKAAGAARITLWRWLQDDSFRAEYHRQRSAITEAALNALRTIAARAVSVLYEVLDDSANPPSARVQAAGKVLDLVVRLREVDDIEPRLEAIEAALEDQQEGGDHARS